MSGTSSINLAGSVKVATSRRMSTVALMQAVGSIEAKSYEVEIAPGATNVPIPLPFPVGVAEMLVVCVYTARRLLLELTSSDATTPGPMQIGIKGHQMLTIYPGAGVTLLKVSNPSLTDPVNVELVVGCKAAAADPDPAFFADS